MTLVPKSSCGGPGCTASGTTRTAVAVRLTKSDLGNCMCMSRAGARDQLGPLPSWAVTNDPANPAVRRFVHASSHRLGHGKSRTFVGKKRTVLAEAWEVGNRS